ncbi:inner nuclear membrane protein Man1-like isoform X2 [Tribolium madens]|uniref:inner nuclear membrane protein Man1-like isoform X2 n=1 Tax=Tribolium madens TaxID=41895 RepID=UPI001CF7302D|nr:inner nuclear membrane protein Man1-like isoform X2 [Tribolium madens]
MVDVDNLSDAELRSKLIEFGFPVMPITGTTRKTMAKKLKMLLENKTKIGKDTRRSLGRYSSEDESDSDAKSSKKDKLRRQTMAAPLHPPSRRKTTIEASDEEAPVRKEIKTSTTTTRTMKILHNAQDEFDTGSDSDEVAEKFQSFRKETPESFKKESPGRLPASFASASSAAEAASDRISQIRSRLSQYNSGFDRSYSPSDDLLKDKENTPFLSNFTKRLSQLSESPKSTLYDYKSDIIKENDVNGGATSRSYLNRASRGRPSTYDYKPFNQSIFKNNFVPFMVLVAAFLFFIVVAVLYLGIRSDTALDVSATIPHCSKSNSKSKRFVNCILEGEGKSTLHLLQVLKPELNRRALINKCENHNVKPYMTEQEIVTFIAENYAIKEESRIMTDLQNLEVLAFHNPSWGINVLLLNKNDVAFDENSIAWDMSEVNEGRRSKVIALLSRNPYIPWNCYFYNTLWSFLSLVTSLLGAALLVYTLNYVFKCYKQIRQKQHEEEMSLVESIIDILQTNATENGDNYMVINHVRDMILPINERKNKQKLWARAVRYIQENESRIRIEEKAVQGEYAEVWRWLGGANLNTSKNKSWQGQAFETQVGSVNSLPCSPTPCLKIRGMVEDGDRNTHVIKKAVLSKCAQQCRILHCVVDTNSNCVYLKCADTSDAAVAYRNLHGWWYAGNLVTVKYLRLERYMQRFPDSPVSGPPFLQ